MVVVIAHALEHFFPLPCILKPRIRPSTYLFSRFHYLFNLGHAHEFLFVDCLTRADFKPIVRDIPLYPFDQVYQTNKRDKKEKKRGQVRRRQAF